MKRTKIVVIGSGILGAAVSFYLASMTDYDITIVEKGNLASGASGANLGSISILDRAQRWHMPLALDSLKIYQNIQSETDVEFEQSGGGAIVFNDDEIARIPLFLEKLSSLGVDGELLQGSRINEWEPYLNTKNIKGFLYCPLEGKVNPLKITTTFLSKAVQLGAKVLTHTQVQGFVKKGMKISSVETCAGDLEADIVVNATGAWAGSVATLAEVFVPIDYHRGTALVTQAVSPIIRGPIVGAGRYLFPGTPDNNSNQKSATKIGLGIVQTATGALLISQASENSKLDDRAVSLEGISLITQNALHYFPGLGSIEIARTFANITPRTSIVKPYYGFAANAPNFFTLSGFKGAFTTAPALGKIAASDIVRHAGGVV